MSDIELDAPEFIDSFNRWYANPFTRQLLETLENYDHQNATGIAIPLTNAPIGNVLQREQIIGANVQLKQILSTIKEWKAQTRKLESEHHE